MLLKTFKPVWDVLKALRSHDEVLADTLDQYRTQMAKVNSNRRQIGLSKIVQDLPVTVDASFSKALTTYLVESTTASWEFWFGLLEDYRKEFGDCLVPAKHQYKGYPLGGWVRKQRWRREQRSPDQLKRLNKLGFSWDPRKDMWETAFSLLQK